MKDNDIKQELNKRFGDMSVKEFADKLTELANWLDGYLKMIYPSLDEEVRIVSLTTIVLSDLCYGLVRKNQLSRVVADEKNRLKEKIEVESKANNAVDDMLKGLGIKKENNSPDNNSLD